eukprot:518705-Pelagomonas_calceolata.AAC.5
MWPSQCYPNVGHPCNMYHGWKLGTTSRLSPWAFSQTLHAAAAAHTSVLVILQEVIAQSAGASCAADSGSRSGSRSGSSSGPAKEAVSLAAAALQGGSIAASFGPGILTLLARKAGPAAAASGVQQSGLVDDVTDCCAYLAKL